MLEIVSHISTGVSCIFCWNLNVKVQLAIAMSMCLNGWWDLAHNLLLPQDLVQKRVPESHGEETVRQVRPCWITPAIWYIWLDTLSWRDWFPLHVHCILSVIPVFPLHWNTRFLGCLFWLPSRFPITTLLEDHYDSVVQRTRTPLLKHVSCLK